MNDASILHISFIFILSYNSDSTANEKINNLENLFIKQVIKNDINLKY